MARRFGKRRRPRVVWLKNAGSLLDSGLTPLEQSSFVKSFQTMAFGPGNPSTLVEIPLVLDNPQEVGGTATAAPNFVALQEQSLSNEQQLGYRLRRIVGDLHVAVGPTSSTDGTAPGLIAVTAAIIVRRVDSFTGLALVTGLQDSLPDIIGNIDDPFIWRRTWLLRVPIISDVSPLTFLPNPPVGDATRLFTANYLNNNAYGTGVNNTVSVDQKTFRKLSSEERLFLDVSFTPFGDDFTTTQDTFSVNHMIFFDYRVLGTLSWSTGNRGNASR